MTTPGASVRFADDAHRYALESRIATGGMGEVWRARDTVLNRPVAVKVLKAEFADDALFRTRFETEARHAGALHHPGVASVFDFGHAAAADGSSSPRPYLVMELVEGQPLSALLRRGEPLDVDAARDLLAQPADALAAAHASGIVHRDVKPANLIVTPDRRVKVTDFGIARAAEGMALTETGQVMGTPQYLSPEQAEGGKATPASDVYSLGVVAFECLTGGRPFVAESPVATALAHLREPVPELPDSVPADLAAVVRRALAKAPTDRYADGAAFAAALRNPSAEQATVVAPAAPPPTAAAEATRTMPAVAPMPAPTTAATPPDRRRRTSPAWLPWALLAAALVVGAIVLWNVLGVGDETDATTDRPSPQRSSSESPSETPRQTPTQTPTQAPTPTPTEEPAPETVTVDEADYLGSDIGDAEAALRELGLKVRKEKVDNPGDQTEGAVAAVDPTGTLDRGETVTLSYYDKAPPGPEVPLTPTDSASPQ